MSFPPCVCLKGKNLEKEDVKRPFMYVEILRLTKNGLLIARIIFYLWNFSYKVDLQ